MTTTRPPATDVGDRFRCEAEVPDPPADAAGRKQYWEDTVAEAVAELRKRLRGTSDERSLEALTLIVDLEKARMRHKEPVAGTKPAPVPYVSPLSPLPPLWDERPRERRAPVAVKPAAQEGPHPAASRPPSPSETVVSDDGGRGSEDTHRVRRSVPGSPLPPSSRRTVSEGEGLGVRAVPADASWQTPLKPSHPLPTSVRVTLQDGIHCHFHDHDDDWMLDPGRTDRPSDRDR